MIDIINELVQEQQIIQITDYYTHEIVAPQFWAKALFSDVCQIVGGSQPPKECFINEPRDGYIRLIQIRDYKTDKFTTYIPIELAKRFCNKDDIMIGRYGPPIFQILRGLEGAYNVALMKAIPNIKLVDKEFLYYFLQTFNLFNYVAAASLRTAGQDGVRKEHLDNYPLFIPPLNEQRRIVAKIEALKARSQRVKEALEAIPPLLDQFRQSVLAAAFRGDLTTYWRKQNPDVEPASVLLELIHAERKKLYEAECKKAETQARKKPTPFKQNIEPIELSKLPTIPNTWCYEKLVNLSNILGGVTKGRKFENRATIMLPYLRVANVQDGFLDLTEIKEIEALPEDLEKYHLEYGDLLFTEGGDRDKLGRGTVWRNDIENCIHQNHVYRSRLYNSGRYCQLNSKVE